MSGLDRDVHNPSAKPLDFSELKIAFRDNVCVHREFIKDHIDPPLSGQEFGVVSFKYLETPLMLPDKELFYGWFKLRGNYPTEDSAVERAKTILQHQDSKSKNKIMKCGAWIPLTSSKILTTEFQEFSDNTYYQKVLDERKKEKEQVAEIKRREEELKKGIDQFEPDSLDYYVTKKVTISQNKYHLEKALEQVKECRENMNKLEKEMAKLDEEHPEYASQALTQYNKKRDESGLSEVKSFDDRR